jgi:transcriptional regulator with XRE-family HTH domain
VAQRKTVRSRRLGKQIRRLRDDAQLSQEKLVELMNADQPQQRRISAAHLSRVESGGARINSEHLDRIVTVLDVAAEQAQKLDALRLRADEPGWWQEYSDIVTETVEMLVEIGEDATTARSYDNAFVQGLLQTRAYAETVIGNDRAFVSPINVDRMADLRMRRQQRLGEDGFQGLTAVMSEGVIRTLVGGRDVMHDQLRHLIDVTQQYPVTIHILPFSAGALPGSDNFVIFEFPDELDGDVVYVEGDIAQRIYEGRDVVRQCTYIFNAALAQALPARESQDLIRAVMEEL